MNSLELVFTLEIERVDFQDSKRRHESESITPE